ncbi:MAG: hypothetical protein CVT48_05605 [Thermoplasmata archaeon HGW-Thermoplasmata-1]|nr:MAG: hypothetical protein CVT48_05605 [Thermoplasmata archaeon HGW-Thermoplasmata-1]
MFSKEIIGKMVVDSEQVVIGSVKEVKLDCGAYSWTSICVKPAKTVKPMMSKDAKKMMDQGMIIIPTSKIDTMKDQIRIIEPVAKLLELKEENLKA